MELLVRGFEMADWEEVAELFLAPRCQWGTLRIPYESRDAIKQRLSQTTERDHRLVAVHQGEQKVVGMIGLHRQRGRREHAAMLGMFVHDDYQNQGIGTQMMQAVITLADQWLDVRRLELSVFVDNHNAIRLYEKFGFVQEGILREFAFREGAYIDAYAMARLRHEAQSSA